MAQGAEGLAAKLSELATDETFLDAYTRRRSGDRYDRELLSFQLADETYAIDIAYMREIVKPRPVTELPRVPDFLLGLVTVRGDVVPVLDLRLRLGFPPVPPNRESRLLICEYEEERFGLQVDGVRSVVRLLDAQIEVPATASESTFMEALGRVGEELIIFLNLQTVFGFDLHEMRGGR